MYHSYNAKLLIRHIGIIQLVLSLVYCNFPNMIKRRNDDLRNFLCPKYKLEVTWIYNRWKWQFRGETINWSKAFLRQVPPLLYFLILFLTPRNSLRSDSRQNELQRNRDNTSLYKVVARWWDSPIRRYCPIWCRNIVPSSCSTPKVVSRMNN